MEIGDPHLYHDTHKVSVGVFFTFMGGGGNNTLEKYVKKNGLVTERLSLIRIHVLKNAFFLTT